MRRLLVVLLLLAGAASAAPKTITVGGKKVRLGPAGDVVVAVPLVEIRDIRLRAGKLADGTICTVASGTLCLRVRLTEYEADITLHVFPLPPVSVVKLKGSVIGRDGVPVKFYLIGPAPDRPVLAGARFGYRVDVKYRGSSAAFRKGQAKRDKAERERKRWN